MVTYQLKLRGTAVALFGSLVLAGCSGRGGNDDGQTGASTGSDGSGDSSDGGSTSSSSSGSDGTSSSSSGSDGTSSSSSGSDGTSSSSSGSDGTSSSSSGSDGTSSSSNGSGTGGASSGSSGSGGAGCDAVECLRPYECATSCDAEPSYVGCCPCDEGMVDQFVDCTQGGDCGGETCANNEYCAKSAGDCEASDDAGSCQSMPDGCTLEYAPVCGCDGATYGNACAAATEGVNVASEGECE